MTLKKSTKSLHNPQRALNLFYELIKQFPFVSILKIDARERGRFVNYFWETYFIKAINTSGYTHLLKIKPVRDSFSGQIYSNLAFSSGVSDSLFDSISKIEKKPQKGIMIKNEHFQFIEVVLRFFVKVLQIIEGWGGWENAIKTKQHELQEIFGFYVTNAGYQTLDSFCSKINEIFRIYFGEHFLELFPDGRLEYVEYIEETVQEYAAIRILVSKKMDNVVKLINKIRDKIHEKDFNDAMAYCRDAFESFTKDFLIQNGITSVVNKQGNPKDVNDMVISELKITLKNEISSIIKFPSFINQNTIQDYFKHYIHSSCEFISTMTNEFSHGKGTGVTTSPSAKKEDVNTTVSYLIAFINNLLYFSK